MIYIDANVFIYAASDGGARGTAAASALRSALVKDAVTASLTLDEFLWAVRKKLDRITTAEKARQLMALDLEIAPVTRDDAEEAILLFENGLDPRDAIHAAVARRLRCATIVSSDPAFDKVEGLRRVDY